MTKLCFLVMSLCLLAGCATQKDQYYWGNYESLVYKMYNEPGEADAGTQVQLLTEDLSKAQSVGKPVPPGFHAHLGYMYIIQGNLPQSQIAFQQEKKMYPESGVLMDKFVLHGKTAKGK